MFVIRPVRDKSLQKAFCTLCDCPYLETDFAYFAAGLDENTLEITDILAICQFQIGEDGGRIHTVRYPSGSPFDEEVITILIRTVMEFLYRCECPRVLWQDTALEDAYLHKIGFRTSPLGKEIDLKTFFASPCHYQAEQKRETTK